jgi:hypothetical protein
VSAGQLLSSFSLHIFNCFAISTSTTFVCLHHSALPGHCGLYHHLEQPDWRNCCIHISIILTDPQPSHKAPDHCCLNPYFPPSLTSSGASLRPRFAFIQEQYDALFRELLPQRDCGYLQRSYRTLILTTVPHTLIRRRRTKQACTGDSWQSRKHIRPHNVYLSRIVVPICCTGVPTHEP